MLRPQNHCTRFRALQIRPIAAIRQERDCTRPCRVQNGHSIDDDVRVTEQLCSDSLGEFPKTKAQDATSAMRPISRPIP